jgi:flagellar biosynthesis protein FliR
LSALGLVAITREIAIGATIGFILKVGTEGALLAGQLIATSMGLSFATVVDPQNGGMPLLGRFYIIVSSLLLLATNAHLTLIALVGQSYQVMPLGAAELSGGEARLVVEFASLMFLGALQLSLPAVVAILMINIAFGVISRAAPTLNLFSVGFPLTILVGLFVLVLSLRSQGPVYESLVQQSLSMTGRLLGGG